MQSTGQTVSHVAMPVAAPDLGLGQRNRGAAPGRAHASPARIPDAATLHPDGALDGDSVAALKAWVAGGGGGGGGGGAAKGPMGGAGSADNLKQVRWEVVLKFFKSQKGMGSKVVQMFKDLDAVSFR